MQKGASRSSPKAEARNPGQTAKRWAAGAAKLARQLVADARLAFVRGSADVPRVAGVLTKLGLSRWTPDDVVLEARQRLREAGGKAMMGADQVKSVAGYLEWLMSNAVPDEPPAQIAIATGRAPKADDALADLRQAAWADVAARDRAQQLALERARPASGRAAARAVAAAAAARTASSSPARPKGWRRSDPRYWSRD